MRIHVYIFFLFFTALFLFYPGDSYYYQLFAHYGGSLHEKQIAQPKTLHPLAININAYAPDISAEGVYILDLPSFTPVYAKNEHERLFPASTTKVITALVAMDLYKPDDIVVIDRVINEGAVMGLVKGERITVENLLYGMLIPSGNDAAYALADHYGYDKFIQKMNEKAHELGMKESSFKNPAGLDMDGHYSTPFDLALASRELLKNKYLSKIVSIKEIEISDVDFKYFHKLENVNKLLGETQGVGGLKTGYTENAGENLITFYRKDGHDFLIVILKSLDRFADTKNVVKWIADNVQYVPLP